MYETLINIEFEIKPDEKFIEMTFTNDKANVISIKLEKLELTLDEKRDIEIVKLKAKLEKQNKIINVMNEKVDTQQITNSIKCNKTLESILDRLNGTVHVSSGHRVAILRSNSRKYYLVNFSPSPNRMAPNYL